MSDSKYENALRDAIEEHQKRLSDLDAEKVRLQHGLDALLAVWTAVTPAVPQISSTPSALRGVQTEVNEFGEVRHKNMVGMPPEALENRRGK